ncbi:unnamed protein product, partial [Prorocentrum cordatum]
RFHFGKWKTEEADFAGRHLLQTPDGIAVDQEKYIREQLSTMYLTKDRRSQPESPLSRDEISSHRTVAVQVQWLARESRPDVAGSASLLAAALPAPSVADALALIKVCKHVKAPLEQRLTTWALDPSSVTFVTASDAGGPGSARRGGAQGAWLITVADSAIRDDRRARVSLPAWRSPRIKRAAPSTVAAETLALPGATGEAQWMQVLWRDAVWGDVPRPDWFEKQGPFSMMLARECQLSE